MKGFSRPGGNIEAYQSLQIRSLSREEIEKESGGIFE